MLYEDGEDDKDDEEEEEGRAVDHYSRTAEPRSLVQPQGKPVSEFLEGLTELLFLLNILLSCTRFDNGQPSSTLLVYFSSILSFSNNANDFSEARNYTPRLSSLIYI